MIYFSGSPICYRKRDEGAKTFISFSFICLAGIKNLTRAITQAGIEVEDLVLSPLASAQAVLSKRQITQLAALELPCVFQFYASPSALAEIAGTLDTLNNMEI